MVGHRVDSCRSQRRQLSKCRQAVTFSTPQLTEGVMVAQGDWRRSAGSRGVILRLDEGVSELLICYPVREEEALST